MTKKWYNWPRGYTDKNYLPWHSIVRRITMVPFLVVVIALGAIITALGWGLREAKVFIRDVCN